MAQTFTLSEAIESIARDEEEAKKYPTGLSDIDRLMRGGIWAKSITVLCAPPNAGKTTLAAYWAWMWSSLTHVYVVAADEPWEGWVSRYAQLMGFDRNTIEDGADKAEIYDLLDRSTKANWTFVTDDGPVRHLLYMASVDKNALVDSIIIIDSLQRLSGAANSDRRTEINAHLADCKALRAAGATVVIISEAGRSLYGSNDKVDVNLMAAGKESGDIEYLADNLLVLEPSKTDPSYVRVNVTKCRRGKKDYAIVVQLDGAKVIDRPEADPGKDRKAPPGRIHAAHAGVSPPSPTSAGRNAPTAPMEAAYEVNREEALCRLLRSSGEKGITSVRAIEDSLSLKHGTGKAYMSAVVDEDCGIYNLGTESAPRWVMAEHLPRS